MRVANLYEFEGDDLQRHEWLTRASDLLPRDIALMCEVAALDLSLGKPESAAAQYDKVLAARPDDGDIIFLRAEVSALMEQEADAERRIEDYLTAHRDDEAAQTRAVEFYRRMRLVGSLERKLAAAARARPDDLLAACELARFYLEHRRDPEAVACLSHFDASRLGTGEQAAAAFRFSELLKGSSLTQAEIRWARLALEKDPSRPEYALHLADLLQANGQTDDMISVLRKACETVDHSPPREDVDRRLFLALQAGKQTPPEEHGRPVKPGVEEMIESLEAQAQQRDSEALWLRLARWLRWADIRSRELTTMEIMNQKTANGFHWPRKRKTNGLNKIAKLILLSSLRKPAYRSN